MCPLKSFLPLKACVDQECKLNWVGKNNAKEVSYFHSTSSMAGRARPTTAVTSVRSSRTHPFNGNIKKDTCTPMFTAALFTTAKTWKQPKCPLTGEWIKKMWYIYTMEYYSAIKKEWNNAICSNMDGPGDYQIKWSKSDTERQISYDITYMWNLKKKKWHKWTYLQNRNRSTEWT